MMMKKEHYKKEETEAEDEKIDVTNLMLTL